MYNSIINILFIGNLNEFIAIICPFSLNLYPYLINKIEFLKM